MHQNISFLTEEQNWCKYLLFQYSRSHENQDQPLEQWHKNLWLNYCQPLDFEYLLGSR